LFWWNFVFSSKFGRILQNHKTGWIKPATVTDEDHGLHCRHDRHCCSGRRHAPSHAVARLLAVAVKWPSSWRPHPLLPVTTPCCNLSFLFHAQRRRAPCAHEIRLARSLSAPPEHPSSFAKSSAIFCASYCTLYPAIAPIWSILLNSGRKRRRGASTVARPFQSITCPLVCCSCFLVAW
jgi:hypothetical protein